MVYLLKMRVLFLTLSTLVVSVAVVMNAYSKKQQFYPTMIYLMRSNRTMSILYIQAFLLGWQFVKFIKFIFFGSLRAIEVEHLIEKSWFAVIDTFILLAAFHEELSPIFVGLVTFLFAVKSFHWLISDRIDHMEQSPVITLKFHIRSVVLLSILCAVDILYVRKSWNNVKTRGLSVDIVFGLEYAIMFIDALNTYLRYIFHAIDLRNENPWENKPIYIRYVNIVLGVLELLLYAGYMAFMLMIPFIPLHIARRVYRAARDFQRSVYEVVTSHQAIRNLNTLYPDATTEELQTANNVCIICREEMVQQCKKLPCNHIFHTNCLRSWFQRQHTCPTCRLDVLRQAQRTRHQQGRQQQRNTNAQQQRQPAAAPPHPMMFPPMMGWPPVPQQQPPPPQQAPPPPQQAQPENQQGQGTTPSEPNQNETTSQPTAQSQPTNPPATGGYPGQFVPPPFPPPPFMMPFYLPFGPQSGEAVRSMLSGLTDEQLYQLEGMERSNVEARIALLRNIQKLLDTAVLQMNQYTTLMSSLNYPAGPGFPGYPCPMTEVPHPQQTPPDDSNTDKDGKDTPTHLQRSISLGNRLSEAPVAAIRFGVKELIREDDENDGGKGEQEQQEDEEGEGEGPKSTKQPSVDLPESELIRQRRLQRFFSVPVSSSDPIPLTRQNKKEDNEEPSEPSPS